MGTAQNGRGAPQALHQNPKKKKALDAPVGLTGKERPRGEEGGKGAVGKPFGKGGTRRL